MSDQKSWDGPRPQADTEPTVPPLRLALQGGDLRIVIETSGQYLGRHTEADVRVALADVSRQHCRFVFRDGQWLVLDLNSLNGTFVNEECVHQASLQAGDILRVGSFRFLVEIGSPDETTLAERIFRIPVPGQGSHFRKAS
jgi:predicted component of type VI protein secretion system